MVANKILLILFVFLFIATPSFAAQLDDEDFDDGDASDTFDMSFSRAVWTDINSTHYRSAPYGCEIDYTPDYGSLKWDFPGGSVSEGDEYYVTYWMYFPSGWNWNSISGTGFKQIQGWPDNSQPASRFKPECSSGYVRHTGGFICNYGNGNCTNLVGDGPCILIPTGEWVHFEFWVKWSTTDGRIRAWFAGDLVWDLGPGDNLTYTVATPSWFDFPTYNGRGQSLSVWVDDVEFHDSVPSGDDPEDCTTDSVDEDGDGDGMECDDPECLGQTGPDDVECGGTEDAVTGGCTDGGDNDADNVDDCQDTDCRGSDASCQVSIPANFVGAGYIIQ